MTNLHQDLLWGAKEGSPFRDFPNDLAHFLSRISAFVLSHCHFPFLFEVCDKMEYCILCHPAAMGSLLWGSQKSSFKLSSH